MPSNENRNAFTPEVEAQRAALKWAQSMPITHNPEPKKPDPPKPVKHGIRLRAIDPKPISIGYGRDGNLEARL